MLSSRRRHSGKKASSVSPASSPSSAVLIQPKTRARRASAIAPIAPMSREMLHSPNCATNAITTDMNSFDFQSPPASPESSDHQSSVDGDASPHSDKAQSTSALSVSTSVSAAAAAVRRRRKRIAIELPSDQASKLNKSELKKLKNRIAAARARERTQKQVGELEATVEQLWCENQQQQAEINHLRGLLQAQQQHQPDFHGAVTHAMPVSYQDMLNTDTAFLMAPPAYERGPCFPPYMAHAHNTTNTDNSTSGSSGSSGSDLHAGLLAEFSEMFPASGTTPHASYEQQQHSP